MVHKVTERLKSLQKGNEVKLDIPDATVVPSVCCMLISLQQWFLMHVVVDQNLHNTVTHLVEV